MAGEPTRGNVNPIVTADGRIRDIEWYDAKLRDPDGTSESLLCIGHDITDRQHTEKALRESEEQLRAILNTAADAIVTIDHSGIIQSVNSATTRMFGYAATEMVGQNVKMLMPSPHQSEHDACLARYLETGVKHIIGTGREVQAKRKNGSVFPAELAISEVDHLKLFTGIIRDIGRRKELEREVVEIASLEQRRIAQDLHDTVSQELTALGIMLSDLADVLRSDPSAGTHLIERMTEGLRRGQRELRDVMRGLLPVAVDNEGLMASLAELADRTQSGGKVNCTFECPEPVTIADNLAATHLYLIAQEAVHNAVKHGKPRNIRIRLKSDDLLTLSIEDDGAGLPEANAEAVAGLGMHIMRNRALIIGATLTVEPNRSTGTRIICTVHRKTNAKEESSGEVPNPDRR